MKHEVMVIGGGAAGLMCAIEAGRRGRKVLVVEHSERLGKKILISGGGRCNFTNVNAGPDNYLSANPHFCKSALARFTPSAFIALVEKHGIAYHEKKLGQQFCDLSSKQIVELLQAECAETGVEILLDCKVSAVRKGDAFEIETNRGRHETTSLVIATGALSFPKIGATDFGYRVAKQFGIKLNEPRPGLVPLTFGASDQAAYGQLSGISIDCVVTCNDVSFRENILFTHRGLSGPAILQVSSFWREGDPITVNLFPDKSAHELLGLDATTQRRPAKELVNLLSEHLPRRFAQIWCERHAPSRAVNKYLVPELEQIAQRLHQWEIRPAGTEGYAKAEVTVGGVDTNELSSKTMESRKVPGLYFIGEVVDVTGWLGGYNFQWAWASGFVAGHYV